MAEIIFKATRRKHGSGWREIEKRGDLHFDFDPNSKDGIWLYTKDHKRIAIDCDYKTGEFRIFFNEDDLALFENGILTKGGSDEQENL